MIIYLHMHKCAGTSVIRAAQASGLRLPAVHQNGNLLNAAGKPVKYRPMPRRDVVALLRRQIDAGVEFMAMEWDFPRWDTFDAIDGLRFFTTLRDPLARAISNFKMDKVAGWIAQDLGFRAYLNGGALYCADNYYVKMLAHVRPRDAVIRADLDHAMAVLARFEGVIVIEQGNMRDVLARFGIAPQPRRFNAFDGHAARTRLGNDRHLWVSQAEIRDFIARNAFDYTLYRHFTRSIRLADRPVTREIAHA